MDALTEIVSAPDQRRKGLLSRGLFGSLQTFLITGMFMSRAPLFYWGSPPQPTRGMGRPGKIFKSQPFPLALVGDRILQEPQ